MMRVVVFNETELSRIAVAVCLIRNVSTISIFVNLAFECGSKVTLMIEILTFSLFSLSAYNSAFLVTLTFWISINLTSLFTRMHLGEFKLNVPFIIITE